jgi:amino acid adenylation domain-containing protein
MERTLSPIDVEIPDLRRLPDRHLYPLTLQQRSLWTQIRLRSDVLMYNSGLSLQLAGYADPVLLRSAIADVLNRQDALRATFHDDDGTVAQRIAPRGIPDFRIEDLSALPEPVARSVLARREHETVLAPYDLTAGPLLRFRLFRLGTDRQCLLIALHHLIVDGVTVTAMAQEILAAYRARWTGSGLPAPPPLRYQDFAVWQSEVFESGGLAAQEAFWRERLRDLPAALELPFDRPRPPLPEYRGGWLIRDLPLGVAAALRQVGAGRGASLFQTVLAVLCAFLHRLTGEGDVVVGVAATNRPPELREVVGCFVTMLPIRTEIAGDPRFADLVAAVSGRLREAVRHREFPIEEALRQTGTGLQRTGPFTVAMTQVAPLVEQDFGPFRLVEAYPCNLDWALLDLHLGLEERSDGLRLRVNYDVHLFDAATAKRLVTALVRLLASAAGRPEERLSELALFEPNEASQFLLRPEPPEVEVPLAFHQHDIWLRCHLHPENPWYNCFFGVTLDGPLQAGALLLALQETVDRHGVLRSVFRLRGEHPVMRVLPLFAMACPQVDLTGLEEAVRQPVLRSLEGSLALIPFDLERGPLLRVFLFRLGKARHRLVCVAHHLILDQVNHGPLVREIVGRCEVLQRGEAQPVEPLVVQYRDFAAWQHRRRKQGMLLEQHAYWLQRLRPPLPVTSLRLDHAKPRGDRSFAAAEVHLALPPDIAQALARLRSAQGTSLFRLVIAAFAALAWRLDHQPDVLVLVPVSTKPANHPELVGHFSAGLPLRLDLEGDRSAAELLAHVDGRVRELLTHREFPVGEVLRRLGGEREPGGPSFPLCISQVRPVDDWQGDLRLRDGDFYTPGVVFDLWLLVLQATDRLHLQLKYDVTLYEPATAVRLVRSLESVLRSVSLRPQARVGELDVMPAAERWQVLGEWSGREAQAPPFVGAVHERIAVQARRTPDAVAAEHGVERVSYGELARRAAAVAGWLRRRGIEREERVGVFGERGVGMLAALLGVYQSGGGYLPLDPGHPDARLAAVLIDSGARLVLTGSGWEERLQELGARVGRQLEVLDWDAMPPGPAEPDLVPARCAGPHALANVFYTSGSTGAPKGALVEHGGLLAHLWAKIALFNIGVQSVVAQNASHGFDISIWQFLSPLLVGGRVVIYSDEVAQEPDTFLARIERDGVTVLETVPSLLEPMLSAAPESVRLAALPLVVSNAETLPVSLCRRWLERFPGIPLVNTYGATECSDDVTHVVLDHPGEEVQRLSVGRPIPGMRVYVLDRELRPVPFGWPGQIAFAGFGVGRGYLADAARTAGSFVPNPLSDEELGGRLYLAGDLGCFGPRGELMFLRRMDNQVKVRGHRIELGEVEAALSRLAGVRQAAALVRSDDAGQSRLIGYVVGEPGLDGPTVRLGLRAVLPEAMIPEQYVFLPALPINRNGKVDRRSLAALVVPDPEAREESHVEPRPGLERTLAEVWREVLQVERVGAHDNFFELGGHSLKSIQIASRLRQSGFVLEAQQLFQYQTVAELAAALADAGAASRPALAAPPADFAIDLDPEELESLLEEINRP